MNKDVMPDQDYVIALRQILDVAVPRFGQLDEQAAAQRPAPGKWSPKEIVGHLIDSACNNHQRFVRAQLTEDLIFDRYEQVQWVALQAYGLAPWHELVSLWALYNRHLLHVMVHASAEARRTPRVRHNLDVISTCGIASSVPATLEDLMADYVKHLQNHVRQILPD